MHLKTSKQKKSRSSLKKAEFIYSEKEISLFFKKHKKKLIPSAVICLSGDLGVGKSTFVKSFFKFIDKQVFYSGSPTFPLVNEYSFDYFQVIHCDFYRLESEDECEHSGVVDRIMPEKNKLIFCEWIEKFQVIKNQLKKNAQKNKISFIEINIGFYQDDMNKRVYTVIIS